MSDPHSPKPETKPDSVLEVMHVEKTGNTVQGGYSGAAEKTDPVEIALVRKLDRRIMVSQLDFSASNQILTLVSPSSGPCIS